MSKKTASIIGIIIGIVIIIVGLSVRSTNNYGIGENIKFGADFYTEMYTVTKEAGRAINYAVNDLIKAVGWLIVAIGLVDVAYFVRKMVSDKETDSGNYDSATQAATAAAYTTQHKVTPPPSSTPSISNSASTLRADEWKCTCGKIHRNYVMSCVCGVKQIEAKKNNSQNS